MCRAGGRRCPNAGGRSTQNTRKAVSRARAALRQAKATGDTTAIEAAQQRLADARTAHHHAKEHTVNHRDHDNTADQHGDVTTPRHTDQPDSSHHDNGPTPDERPGGFGFVLHNTNIAESGAHVGSQHDVVHGDSGFVRHRGHSTFTFTPAQAGDVTDRVRDALRRVEDAVRQVDDTARRVAEEHDDRDGQGRRHGGRSTHNTASGDDVVSQQIGINLGDILRRRRG